MKCYSISEVSENFIILPTVGFLSTDPNDQLIPVNLPAPLTIPFKGTPLVKKPSIRPHFSGWYVRGFIQYWNLKGLTHPNCMLKIRLKNITLHPLCFLHGCLEKISRCLLNQLLHPGRLTWNLHITHLERKMIFQTSLIMFHVNL